MNNTTLLDFIKNLQIIIRPDFRISLLLETIGRKEFQSVEDEMKKSRRPQPI